jgi:hypothetical protein
MWIVLKRWRPHWDSAPTQSGPLRRHRRFQDQLRLRHNPTPDPQLLPRHGYQPKSTFTNITTINNLDQARARAWPELLINSYQQQRQHTPGHPNVRYSTPYRHRCQLNHYTIIRTQPSSQIPPTTQGCSKSNLDIFSINAHFFLHDHSPTYCTEIKASAHNDANNDRNVPISIKQHPMLTTPQQQISPTPPPHLPPPLAR